MGRFNIFYFCDFLVGDQRVPDALTEQSILVDDSRRTVCPHCWFLAGIWTCGTLESLLLLRNLDRRGAHSSNCCELDVREVREETPLKRWGRASMIRLS